MQALVERAYPFAHDLGLLRARAESWRDAARAAALYGTDTLFAIGGVETGGTTSALVSTYVSRWAERGVAR